MVILAEKSWPSLLLHSVEQVGTCFVEKSLPGPTVGNADLELS